jgi:tRNA(Ile)-lysidine synthase
MALAAVKGDLRRISFRHIRAVESLVAAALPNGRIDLPDGIRVTRAYERLLFTATREELPPEEFELTITLPGSYKLPCGQILTVDPISVLPAGWRSSGAATLFVSPEVLPLPWTVRYFRAGDRLMPLGMAGEKKLKDLFIDRKVPLPQRRRVPLLLCDGRIFWAGGVQLSELARLSGDEQMIFRICLAAAE